MMGLILNVLTLGLKPLYERHLEFHQIITDFRNKLPRPQNQAKILTGEEKEKVWRITGSSLQHLTTLNVESHKVSLSENDLDEFYNKLNNFDYRFILFKNYYKQYIRNLNRFNPVAENKNFELAVLQKAIEIHKRRPTEPCSVLWFHFKYRYKLTSKPYMWFKRKRNKSIICI